jgi:predicted RNA-binding Zn ribbon-like protein
VPRPQTFTTVKDIPLVGGSLCLDFVNTTGARGSAAPRERLTCYGDLLTWGQRAGIVGADNARRLRRAAATRKREAANALRKAHSVREDMYDLLSAFVDGRRPTAEAVARVSAHWRAARRNQELVLDQGGFTVRTVEKDMDLGGLISPIVAAAVDLLTSDRLAQMKRCAECDWLFLDTSKNRTRRWCKSTCGNRARSRERYDRRRTERSPGMSSTRIDRLPMVRRRKPSVPNRSFYSASMTG